MLDSLKTIDELWKYTSELNKIHFPDTDLAPIMGGGKIVTPAFMFVFINPTIKNISTDKNWQGARRPFLGTKHIWRIFFKAGLFDGKLVDKIEHTLLWTPDFADEVYSHLSSKGFYFTNLVKWSGYNADLPDKEKIALFLPILKKEIDIVKPKTIITFGLMPFNALSKTKIKLLDYYEHAIEQKRLASFEIEVYGNNYKLIPSYFPVGRGSPKKAVELLSMLRTGI